MITTLSLWVICVVLRGMPPPEEKQGRKRGRRKGKKRAAAEGDDTETKKEKRAKRARKSKADKCGSVLTRLRKSIKKEKDYEAKGHLREDPTFYFKQIYVEMASKLQGELGGLVASILVNEWDTGTFVAAGSIAAGIPNLSTQSVQYLLIEQCERLGLMRDEAAVCFKFDQTVFAEFPKPKAYADRVAVLVEAVAKKK